MKYLLALLILVTFPLINAEDLVTIKSDKLNLIVNSTEPNVIPIIEPRDNIITLPRFNAKIIFDVDNVQAIIVNDLNAKNGKCRKGQEYELFFLSFDEDINVHKKINVRMRMPCVSEYKAMLQLLVRTVDKKVYSNIVELKYQYRDTKTGKHTFAIEYE